MQVLGVQFNNIKTELSSVANNAININSALKASTDKITENIRISEKATQKIQELNDEYEKTLQAVSDIKKLLSLFSTKAEFIVNKDINRVVVRIVDKVTNSLIREVPSKEIQNIQKRIKDLLYSLFGNTTDQKTFKNNGGSKNYSDNPSINLVID